MSLPLSYLTCVLHPGEVPESLPKDYHNPDDLAKIEKLGKKIKQMEKLIEKYRKEI